MEVIISDIELEMTLEELFGLVGKDFFFVPTMISDFQHELHFKGLARRLHTETTRIIIQVRQRPLPFALKLQQASQASALILFAESESHSLCSNVLTNILANFILYLNASNAHLHPANIVLPDFVEHIAADLGVTFLIEQGGYCTVICGTTQHFVGVVFTSASHINYRNRPLAEERLSDVMEQIGKFLHQKGYYGAINTHVLEKYQRRAVHH